MSPSSNWWSFLYGPEPGSRPNPRAVAGKETWIGYDVVSHQARVLLTSVRSDPWIFGELLSSSQSRERRHKFVPPWTKEKEMATHSSILVWRIPGMEEPGGLPSVGSHRVGHDWSDLVAAAEQRRESSVKGALWDFMVPFPYKMWDLGSCTRSCGLGRLASTPGSWHVWEARKLRVVFPGLPSVGVPPSPAAMWHLP